MISSDSRPNPDAGLPSRCGGHISRPVSAVPQATSLIGIVTLPVAWWVSAFWKSDTVLTFALLFFLPALTMAGYELAIRKVHLNPSTGLDFNLRHPLRASIHRTIVKTLAHWSAWCLVAIYYWLFKEFHQAWLADFFNFLSLLLPVIAVLTPFYILFVDRRQVDPYDASWHAGSYLIGRNAGVELSAVRAHFVGYMLRAFFLPFIAGALPGLIRSAERLNFATALTSPHMFYYYFADKLWVIDCVLGSIGYIVALRVLDSHVRSIYAFATSWLVTLVCYPPYNAAFFTSYNYYQTDIYWDSVIPVDSMLGYCWMLALATSWVVNIWSNSIFGMRFSNLTNRGIITSGPYRYLKHPSYLFKNIAWWLTYIPFVNTGGWVQATRACLIMGFINLIYYLRAKSEERELMIDPVYREYSAYIDEHGLVARVRRWGKHILAGTLRISRRSAS